MLNSIYQMYQVRTTTHDLRGLNKLIVPCVKATTHGSHSVRYASTTIWNGLPEDLRSMTGVQIQSAANFVSANVIIQVIR